MIRLFIIRLLSRTFRRHDVAAQFLIGETAFHLDMHLVSTRGHWDAITISPHEDGYAFSIEGGRH